MKIIELSIIFISKLGKTQSKKPQPPKLRMIATLWSL